MLTIKKGTVSNIDELAPLFDQYRIFYGQDSDIKASSSFIKDRLAKNESVIFIACIDANPVGFTQLFFTFSSVTLQPSILLNDLFVNKAFRGRAIGTALLEKAKEYCSTHKFKGLGLETAIDNPAQQLYEKLGWKKDSHCFHYFWTSN